MEHPSYYGILPASVRYSDEITQFQKILYCEISALTNQHGYCFASNAYFAELYNCQSETISRGISALQKAGFIQVDIDKSGGNQRKIYLSEQATLLTKKSIGIDKKVNTPIDKKVKYNNTSINNKNNREHSREILQDETFKNQLKEKFPAVNVDIEIDKAIDWLSANGRRYKNYAAFMRNWVRREAARQLEILKKEGKIYTPAPRTNPAPAPIKRDNMHLL